MKYKYKEGQYCHVWLVPLNDPNLSFKAKGVMCYILSRPDDWNIIEASLVSASSDMRSSIRSVLKELKENGYLCETAPRKVTTNGWMAKPYAVSVRILQSCYTQEEWNERQRSIKTGFNDFEQRPMNFDELESKLLRNMKNNASIDM